VQLAIFGAQVIASTPFIHIPLLKTEMTERICTSNRNTRRI